MKKLAILFVSVVIAGGLFVSFSPSIAKGVYYLHDGVDGQDNIPDNLFIPDMFFTKYKLDMQPRSNAHIKDWSTMDRDAKFAVVDDVRWVFDNTEKAMDYHKKNLRVNSESGVEIPKVNIPGVQELHVFRESKSITDMNKDMNIDTKEFYFIFVIDKVVAKVFVSVNGNVSVDDASVFAKEAAKDIHKSLGK